MSVFHGVLNCSFVHNHTLDSSQMWISPNHVEAQGAGNNFTIASFIGAEWQPGHWHSFQSFVSLPSSRYYGTHLICTRIVRHTIIKLHALRHIRARQRRILLDNQLLETLTRVYHVQTIIIPLRASVDKCLGVGSSEREA